MVENNESNSSILSQGSSLKLRILRHQTLHACIIIQRYARGYITRKRLWSYGGVVYVSFVLKVQCAWRQYLALKAVKLLWAKKVERSIHSIHSLFYIWKSRRLRRIIRLTYLKNVITKFQANVRRKLMRKKYLILLFIHRTKNAKKIQSVIREFLGKCQVALRRNCAQTAVSILSKLSPTQLTELIRNDVSFIISHKTLEISKSFLPNLYQNIIQFSLSILYDLSINNQFMSALTKIQYLNVLFQKIQYNLLSFLKRNKNIINKLLLRTTGDNTSSSLLQQIQSYHQFQYLLQFINYLTRMNLWTKYNKTRQIHILLLEQSLGVLSCQTLLMNYNYPSEKIPTTDLKANPFSLSSLLLFPRQILNRSQQSITSTTSASLTSQLIAQMLQTSPALQDISKQSEASPRPNSTSDPSLSSSDITKAALNTSTAATLTSFSLLIKQALATHWNWKGYSYNQLLSTLYSVSSNHSISLLRSFDSIMFKVDTLLYQLSFPLLFDSIAEGSKQLVERSFPDARIFPVDEREDSITNRHLYISTTRDEEDSSLAIHHGLPFYRILPNQPIASATSTIVPEIEMSPEKIDLNAVQDIKEFRRLQRLKKEKKVIQKKRQLPKSARHRTLLRIWRLLDQARELVVPGSLDSYELSYRMDFFNALFQTVHDHYVLRDLVKDFVITLDANGLPVSLHAADDTNSSHSHQTRNHRAKQPKNLTHQKQITSFTIPIQLKVIISGSLIFVTGAIPPPASLRNPSNSNGDDASTNSSTSSQRGTVPEEDNNMGGGKSNTANSANQRLLQSFVYEKIPLFPWPVHPLILFPHEINQVANDHRIFSIQQFSILNQGGGGTAHRIFRRLSSNQWLDYEKFADYLLAEMSLTFTNTPTAATTTSEDSTTNGIPTSINTAAMNIFMGNDSELFLSFFLPEIYRRRKLMLDNNIMKYSVIIIQRIFRGYRGRQRFRLIREKYLVMKRKRYLSYKVFYRLKVMYANHQAAATQIQRIIRGTLVRRRIRRWNYLMLKIQCLVRIFFAKKRVAEEKKRLFDGPQVVLLNRGGKMIEIQSQLLLLMIYRCENHFKFVGTNAMSNVTYLGYLYEKELKRILLQYNQDVVTALRGDKTSVYSKQLQIQPWQHEKLIGFFYRYLNLLPKVINVTTQFSNLRREESRYYLAVCYQSSPSMPLLIDNDTMSSESQSAKEGGGGVSVTTSIHDAELQKVWKHNYGNIYSQTVSGDLRGVSLPNLPTMEAKRLQTEIPREFDYHPVLESVKKFQVFKEFNQTRRKKQVSSQSTTKKQQKKLLK